MQCPRCRQENRAGRKFCSECGASLALACPSCGFSNEPGEKFCGGCGTSLGVPTTPRFAAPESYTPKHLAEKILTSKSALEGERKQVTVLFADLKGSMELLADRDPEEARKILDPVLERMMEAVHRYEGTVNQVMGDGIMALFGAPVAHEDHAVRACYAALRMQDSGKGYAEDVRRSHGAAVRIRVGLNSGEVVVRAIGSDLHMDYTAVGQTTHLAARMEQLASPGSILITPSTLKLVEGSVAVTPLGPVPVKGLADAVDVYELIGVGPARTRFQAAARRGLTPFVGRDTELDQLRRALEQASAGHGQVLAVVGEPGVGKSRLYGELTRSHRTEGWLVLESASVSYGKTSTYLPVIDLLKTYFNVDAHDSHRAIQEKVSGKLTTLDQTLLPILPAFLALLDVPVADPQWRALEPAERRQRTLEACRRLLLRESRVQPLLLVFEDLHWIDSATQALLDGMVESLPGARILLLVNYRPEYQHAWGSKTYYAQLRLDPLVQEGAEELLRGLLGNAQELESLKRRLVERTEGNPFFLEESVRTLVETGALLGERGAYRPTTVLNVIQIPGTVQAILAGRIDRLGPDEKHLLQSAAVIGKDVPLWLLQAIVDEREDTLRYSLARLQTAEFFYETSLFPEVGYTFKHALTHEVAYGSLLQDRRRALHAGIVESIEQRYPDRLVEDINPLAHHAFRGEVWHKAVPYLREAGARAGQRSAFREAVTLFEQALDALAHLSESSDTLGQAIDLRIELSRASVPSGDFAKAHAHLSDAVALAQALGDRRRLGEVLAELSHARRAVGPDQHNVIETAQRALEIAREFSDGALEATATQYLAQGYYGLGDFARAIDLIRRAIAAFESQPAPNRTIQEDRRSYGRVWLVHSLTALGQFAEGISAGEEAIRIAEAANRPVRLELALSTLGNLFVDKGDLERAIPLLERAMAVSRAFEIPLGHSWARASLARVYALAERVAEAIPIAEQAVKESVGSINPAFGVLVAADVYIAARRVGEASALLEQALALVRKRAERPLQARALALLGRIAADHDPPEVEEAEVRYRDALALANSLGMRPLVAHCHLGLGKLYRRTGQREQAQEHLATATTMYREMGMRFWLEQAEAAAMELGS